MTARVVALVFALAAGACSGAPRAGTDHVPAAPPATPDLPSFRIDVLDVGTGLAVLVRGEDFTLVYDGGSNDDRRTRRENRLLAYLEHTVGPSGDATCRPSSSEDAGAVQEKTIDHVVLSHPHRDHLSLLPDVFRCYAVRDLWDSGVDADTAVFAAYRDAARSEPGLVVHRPGGEAWPGSRTFGEGDVIELGHAARAVVLSTRPDAADPNDASIVMRLDLGRVSVLLTGDATAGRRRDPAAAPDRGSVEADLIARHAKSIDVDILIVGHHGSMTSTRRAFIAAVSPRTALVSAGPMPYARVTLPDDEVLAALRDGGAQVLRTDVDDEACRASPDKIGRTEDGTPGGCDAITVRIDPSGAVTTAVGLPPPHDG